MRFITDRVRVFLFGICIAFLGIVNPGKAMQTAYIVLARRG